MKKFIQYLKESNRLTHFIAGLIIGFISWGNLWTAVLASSCAAGATEAKDRQYTNKWDWKDFIITVGGGFLGHCLFRLIALFL